MAVVKPRFPVSGSLFREKFQFEIHPPPLFLLDRTAVRSYSNSSPFRHTKALPLGELDAKRPERASPRQKDRCTATGTSLCSCRNIAVPSLPPPASSPSPSALQTPLPKGEAFPRRAGSAEHKSDDGRSTMKLSFTKMQGCANDYIYLDCRTSRRAGGHRGPFAESCPGGTFPSGRTASSASAPRVTGGRGRA